MNKYLALVTSSQHTKYSKWYISIISRALLRSNDRLTVNKEFGYSERHHILPNCLCDNDEQRNDDENLVYLTAKEHFIVHWLLCKIVNSYKVFNAFAKFWQNSITQKRTINGNEYEAIRRAWSKRNSIIHTGQIPWNKGKSGYNVAPLSEEAKLKISKANKGKKRSAEVRAKFSEARKGTRGPDNTGKKWFNDGEKDVLCFDCPPGFTPGKISNATTRHFVLISPDGQTFDFPKGMKSVGKILESMGLSWNIIRKPLNENTIRTSGKFANWKAFYVDE